MAAVSSAATACTGLVFAASAAATDFELEVDTDNSQIKDNYNSLTM